MCLWPTLIRNRKYVKNKKNGGAVPAPPLHVSKGSGRVVYDERVLLVPVGCGECMECRRQKRREWQVRLLEDVRHNKNGKFVTLTFNEESLKALGARTDKTGYERDNAIATIAVKLFRERWRKKFGKSIRHWLVTELGHSGTERIHLHGIIWTDEDSDEITERWGYGYTWIGDKKKNTGYVSERTINYITKYVTKKDVQHKEYKQIVLTSAGIGKGYTERTDSRMNKYNGVHTREYYKNRQGKEMALPIYWRNKIYTEEEREKLWLQKLDENVRYVDGKKIDVSITDEKYFKALYAAREKSKRLGYGDNQKNWDRKRYENQKRNISTINKIKKDNDNNYVPF